MASKKKWNWQQDDWPHFTYAPQLLTAQEELFLENSGVSFGVFKHISSAEKEELVVQLISNEAFKTSEIEGEYLDRESLQSSIRRNFGLKATSTRRHHPAEKGVADMMTDLHRHFEVPLTHDTLLQWHQMLMADREDIENIGGYRTHKEVMQVVSGYMHKPNIHFEAPPSEKVHPEMTGFIDWFNESGRGGVLPIPPLTRACIAHLYFVSIHPFEDGNGRIARALVEKVLAQHQQQPTLIALSQVIQDNKKAYYDGLEAQNKHNKIEEWLACFAATILEAQRYTIDQMEFLIKKTKFFDRYKDALNPRQLRAITRMFEEGGEGFKGGLSAKNYITITKASASTATRDLQELVAKQVLKKEGERKGTRYYLCH